MEWGLSLLGDRTLTIYLPDKVHGKVLTIATLVVENENVVNNENDQDLLSMNLKNLIERDQDLVMILGAGARR